jgi:hypothetical protein
MSLRVTESTLLVFCHFDNSLFLQSFVLVLHCIQTHDISALDQQDPEPIQHNMSEHAYYTCTKQHITNNPKALLYYDIGVCEVNTGEINP